MSKLQVNDIVNKDDDGSVGFSKGIVVTGVATATTFDGNLNATQLASGTIPDARFPAALPALDGSALTNLNIPAGFDELDAALFN
tara:strand:+ start:310 stop:564 length:255 start_codon:yes stop_codon:yes gene_type:complete